MRRRLASLAVGLLTDFMKLFRNMLGTQVHCSRFPRVTVACSTHSHPFEVLT